MDKGLGIQFNLAHLSRYFHPDLSSDSFKNVHDKQFNYFPKIRFFEFDFGILLAEEIKLV